VVSYHGPTARADLSVFSMMSLRRAVILGEPSAGHAPNATVLRHGTATGRLAGGNLALVGSLCGTPWALDFRGCIVVLEDVNEATYRIDRLLTQLRLAGAFDGCVGLALGHFTNNAEDGDSDARTLVEVMQECADALAVPALLGIPCGHIDDQWTLPLGAIATLDADARLLTIHP
jgi:muramoyltetrapeptide carboxypeptidase